MHVWICISYNDVSNNIPDVQVYFHIWFFMKVIKTLYHRQNSPPPQKKATTSVPCAGHKNLMINIMYFHNKKNTRFSLITFLCISQARVWFLMPYVLAFFSVQCFEQRGDCLLCWCWRNCWLSLFSFIRVYSEHDCWKMWCT